MKPTTITDQATAFTHNVDTPDGIKKMYFYSLSKHQDQSVEDIISGIIMAMGEEPRSMLWAKYKNDLRWKAMIRKSISYIKNRWTFPKNIKINQEDGYAKVLTKYNSTISHPQDCVVDCTGMPHPEKLQGTKDKDETTH